MTFAELEYDSKKRRTRREIFLEKMEGLIPWQQLEDRIEPFYAKAGRGRRPYPLGVMLRVHCVQLFYNLSDPGMEDLLYEVLGGDDTSAVDRSSAHRLDQHHAPGFSVGDSLATTAANAADVTQACVLHGDETEAWGDAGYQGVDKRPENRGCGVAWQVAMKPGKRRLLDRDGAEAAAEKRKASVRAKVEHPFLYVKRRFGYGKVRYRGLAKNTQRIALLLGFSNLLIAGRYATG